MIINRIKSAGKILLGRDYAGRRAQIYADDVIVTSYPKSGNTWVRFLIANLLAEEMVTFSNIEKIIPDLYQHDQAFLETIKRPRVLKSHEYFCPDYRKVIYIVRNPLDVAVSYYFHQIKFNNITEAMNMDSFIDDFISGAFDSFGSWGENVGSWLGARNNKDTFLLIRYEDLLSNPDRELGKIATFLGQKKNSQDLLQAVNRSSLENMQKLEQETGKNWKPLKKTRSDMNFVRSGKSGGWEEHLCEKNAQKIMTEWQDIMQTLEYL